MPEPRVLIRWSAAVLLAIVLCAWAAHDVPLNNYDTAYALLWGRDIAGGQLPDYSVGLAPTPHPLATLFGLILSLPGSGGQPASETAVWIWMTFAYLSLLALGTLVFALGRAWFGTAVGVLAAVIVLTREPILSYGLRAYVDIPYICLLLGALLVETRNRRAGTPVLILIALAGLLRPEAWLFAVVYGAWLWHGGKLRPLHVGLVFAAPVLWALSDLAVTGDPLHSLTGTREGVHELGRKTGLLNVPALAPRRIGEILREPVLFGAVGGIAFALWKLPRRSALGAAAVAAALVAFALLATAGLSIITRYLLLPATLLAIFCAAGALGWLGYDGDARVRKWWGGFGVLTLVLLVVFIPSQYHRLHKTDAALDRQQAILTELRGFFAGDHPTVPRGCKPLTLPNRRAVPQVALWTKLEPEKEIRSGQDDGIKGVYFEPANAAVANDFVLDRQDLNKALPPPPAGPPADQFKYWRVYSLDKACE
jgi:hypothetical protein